MEIEGTSELFVSADDGVDQVKRWLLSEGFEALDVMQFSKWNGGAMLNASIDDFIAMIGGNEGRRLAAILRHKRRADTAGTCDLYDEALNRSKRKDSAIMEEVFDAVQKKKLGGVLAPPEEAGFLVAKTIVLDREFFTEFLMNADSTLFQLFFSNSVELFGEQNVMRLAILFRCAILAGLAFFFSTCFINFAFTQRFVALNLNAGSCDFVSKAVTLPQIYADYYGYWQGNPNFAPINSQYQFSIFNMMVSPRQYADYLTGVNVSLTQIGKDAEKRNLAENLLWWSSWQYKASIGPDGSKTQQSVILAGDPAWFVGAKLISGTISNLHGDCNFTASYEAYDKISGELLMEFDSSTFGIFKSCGQVLTPSFMNNLGWIPTVDQSTLYIKTDVRTLFSALAVAYRVNGLRTLEKFAKVKDIFSNVPYLDYTGTIRKYAGIQVYDPNYPGMIPMTCIGPSSSTSEWNCLIRVGSTYGAPFVQQSGTNRQYPDVCNCSLASGLSDACDQIDLLLGMVVFDTSVNATFLSKFPLVFQPFLPFMQLFYEEPIQTAKSISINSYSPAFAGIFSSTIGPTSNQRARQMLDSTWRKHAYQYTYTDSFGYGKVITYRIYSSAGDDDRSISSNNYQLENGACADSMTSPNFKNLIDIPLSPLVEDYYQCTMGYWDAFVNSMGIATTNANNFASLIALPFFFSLWGMAVFFRKASKVAINDISSHLSGRGPELTAQQSGIN